MKLPKLAEIRKAVAAASSAAAVAIGAGLLTGQVAAWVTGGIATVAAALATWAAPANSTPETPAEG